MSETIVFASSTENTKLAQSGALTDDELSVVAGGSQPSLDAFLTGFYRSSHCVNFNAFVLCGLP